MKEEKKKVSYKEIIEKIKPKIEEEVSLFEEELKKIRTARVSPVLIEDIKVEMFNQTFKIFQLGSISVLEPRTLFFQPWDISYLEPVMEALRKSELGISASIQSKGIVISFPPLSEEFRKNLLKMISQKKEILRRRIRNLREKAWNEIQAAFFEKKLSEDEKYKAKKELQDLVDEVSEKIEALISQKEKELEE